MKKLIFLTVILLALFYAGRVTAQEAVIVSKEAKVRLTSMCQIDETTGLMKFREENGVFGNVDWSAKYAGGSGYFANGSVSGGAATFFNAPAGKTIIVDWNFGEQKGSTTKAQNTKACEKITACVDGKTVEWVKDKPLPDGAYEGACKEPTPTPVPVNGISVNGGNAGCGADFEVTAKVVTDGVGVEGVSVEFDYKTEKKTVTTNANGEAKAKYNYQGDYQVTAKAGSYGTASLTADHSDDCPAGVGGGEVLGASTQGQVLGASTMADTGTSDDMLALVFTIGAALTTIGLRPYAKKFN